MEGNFLFSIECSSSIILLRSSPLVSGEISLLTIVPASLTKIEGFSVGVKLEPFYVSAGASCAPI